MNTAIIDLKVYVKRFHEHEKGLIKFYKENEKDLKAYFNDESIPLDIRYEEWLDLPIQLKNTQEWIIHVDDHEGNEISWYDDFNKVRYETVELPELICRLHERNDCPYQSKQKPPNWWKEEAEHFMRYCLKENVHSFVNDW